MIMMKMMTKIFIYYGFVDISDTQVAMKCNDVQPTRVHHEDAATNEPA